MAGGFGLLNLDPQALQQTPQTPQGIPSGVDQGLQGAGLPSMSSVLNGMMNGATGDAQAVGDMGGRIGSMLSGMVGRSGDLMEKFRSGQIGAGEFLSAAAGRAKDMATSAATAPRDAYTGDLQVFGLDGHPTQEAMDRANGMAGLAMTGSLPFKAPAGALRSFGGAPKEDPIAALEAALGFNRTPAAPVANRAADDAIANIQRGLDAGATPATPPADPIAELEAALSQYTSTKPSAPIAGAAPEPYAPMQVAPRPAVEPPSPLEHQVLRAVSDAQGDSHTGKIWDVRDRLPDVPEADLKNAMLGLQQKGLANLSQYSDPRSYRGKLGIDIGGNDQRHLIGLQPEGRAFLTPMSPGKARP
ncbi:hypothetical protein [Methylobacterium sp. WL7]|uniref:hypothetical protein n=1 Tax=Methylobacterium sp. WL7 TaxID=2603900 RepID=UPI0011C70C44|nr:hypothetical protein [Methylobacterium sp. WL7]TXN43587.1 hypothetical protein FV233_17980 [Methylobacterium sp. WL7]